MKAATCGLLFFAQNEEQKQKTTNPSCAAKATFNAPVFDIFAKPDGLTPVYKKKDESPAQSWAITSLLFLFSLPPHPHPGIFSIFSLPS